MDREAAVFEALKLRLVIDKFGTKRYYNNEGQLHREFGPARIYANGDKAWYLNNKYHRTDGPACEWTDGTNMWYINDKRFTEEEFLFHPLCTIKC